MCGYSLAVLFRLKKWSVQFHEINAKLFTQTFPNCTFYGFWSIVRLKCSLTQNVYVLWTSPNGKAKSFPGFAMFPVELLKVSKKPKQKKSQISKSFSRFFLNANALEFPKIKFFVKYTWLWLLLK